MSDPVFLNGEFYLDVHGRTMIRVPARGAGGGVTGYAVQAATEDQHIAYLNTLTGQKDLEVDNSSHEREVLNADTPHIDASDRDAVVTEDQAASAP